MLGLCSVAGKNVTDNYVIAGINYCENMVKRQNLLLEKLHLCHTELPAEVIFKALGPQNSLCLKENQ